MKKSVALLHQLHQTSRVFLKGLNKELERYDIYASEWSILLNLKEYGPMTQATLANHVSIEPPAISNSLMKLERKQLIERRSGLDKRERMVFLTEKTLSNYAQWEEIAENYRRRMLSGLSEEQQDELYQSLKTIYLMVQPQEDDL